MGHCFSPHFVPGAAINGCVTIFNTLFLVQPSRGRVTIFKHFVPGAAIKGSCCSWCSHQVTIFKHFVPGAAIKGSCYYI